MRARALAEVAGERCVALAKVLVFTSARHGVEPLHRAAKCLCRQAREFGDALYITYSLPDCLEVMVAGVSKGRALRVVLERLDVDAANCIAFGDNMNDIDLLETAGHPFMMNNANPDLIKRLPHVPRIGNNFEAGVAHHLRKLFALND